MKLFGVPRLEIRVRRLILRFMPAGEMQPRQIMVDLPYDREGADAIHTTKHIVAALREMADKVGEL